MTIHNVFFYHFTLKFLFTYATIIRTKLSLFKDSFYITYEYLEFLKSNEILILLPFLIFSKI